MIAQRDEAFGEQLATELRDDGYRAIVCPGPLPPAVPCKRCDKGYCPLTEGADLTIYDPGLISLDADGERRTRAVEAALAHPDVPILRPRFGDPASRSGAVAVGSRCRA
jgi:hypothetical protein